jgi:hypothetical protein
MDFFLANDIYETTPGSNEGTGKLVATYMDRLTL